MVATAMVMLTNQIPTWWFTTPVSLILCREIGVSALREWMAEQGQRAVVKVGVIGKWKTAIQMISTALLLYAAPEVNRSRNEMVFTNMTKISPLFTIGVILLYISAYLTLLSGWQYFTAAWPSISSSDDKWVIYFYCNRCTSVCLLSASWIPQDSTLSRPYKVGLCSLSTVL